MPGVFLADVVAYQTGYSTAYKPSLPAGTSFAALMLDVDHMKAVVACPAQAISFPGVFLMYAAATWDALAVAGTTTQPTNPQRNSLVSWCNDNSYMPPAAGQVWQTVVEFVALQVNPAADVDLTRVG